MKLLPTNTTPGFGVRWMAMIIIRRKSLFTSSLSPTMWVTFNPLKLRLIVLCVLVEGMGGSDWRNLQCPISVSQHEYSEYRNHPFEVSFFSRIRRLPMIYYYLWCMFGCLFDRSHIDRKNLFGVRNHLTFHRSLFLFLSLSCSPFLFLHFPEIIRSFLAYLFDTMFVNMIRHTQISLKKTFMITFTKWLGFIQRVFVFFFLLSPSWFNTGKPLSQKLKTTKYTFFEELAMWDLEVRQKLESWI